MDGEQLKKKLFKLETPKSAVSKTLTESYQALSQTLNAVDIKTGFIEKLAVLYDYPILFFFGEVDVYTLHFAGSSISCQNLSKDLMANNTIFLTK